MICKYSNKIYSSLQKGDMLNSSITFGSLSAWLGASSDSGWRRGPADMEASFEYIE